MGEWMYTIHIFLTLALAGGELLISRPGCFTPWYPLDTRLGGTQSWSGRLGENILPFWGSNPDLSVVQPVASR
jgi:hypothetical protein